MITTLFCIALAQPAEEAPEMPMPASVEEAQEYVMMPADGEEVGFVVGKVRDVARMWKAREYGPAISAAIMLLLALGNLLLLRLGKAVRKRWMPTLSIATGIGVGLAINLGGIAAGAGVSDWLVAVGQGLLVGMGAVGAWEWFGKKLMAKKVKAAEEKHGPIPA